MHQNLNPFDDKKITLIISWQQEYHRRMNEDYSEYTHMGTNEIDVHINCWE